MGNILGREAYEEFACYGMPDDYPKSTEEAAAELRKRGGDASVPALNYLIKQGKGGGLPPFSVPGVMRVRVG